MALDKKVHEISEKSIIRLDKVVIILGLSLVFASCGSYFVIEAFGQQTLVLDCPTNTYHGVDNQGNEVCRNIITNQILESESLITNSNLEKIIESDSKTIVVSETRKIIVNSEQTPIVEIIVFVLIVIGGSIMGIIAKKKKLKMFQRSGWSNIQKEQVRNRQYGKCNICFTQPSQWKFNHFDGNKNNDNLDDCQGLCPDCFSVKIQKDRTMNLSNM